MRSARQDGAARRLALDRRSVRRRRATRCCAAQNTFGSCAIHWNSAQIAVPPLAVLNYHAPPQNRLPVSVISFVERRISACDVSWELAGAKQHKLESAGADWKRAVRGEGQRNPRSNAAQEQRAVQADLSPSCHSPVSCGNFVLCPRSLVQLDEMN